jgi:hypothetical protein
VLAEICSQISAACPSGAEITSLYEHDLAWGAHQDSLPNANLSALGHIFVQGTFCPIVTCISLTFQGGHVWASFEPMSLSKLFTRKPSVFFGVGLGVNGATADEAMYNNRAFGVGVADTWGGAAGESWYTPNFGSSQDFKPYAEVILGDGFMVQGSQVDTWRFF